MGGSDAIRRCIIRCRASVPGTRVCSTPLNTGREYWLSGQRRNYITEMMEWCTTSSPATFEAPQLLRTVFVGLERWLDEQSSSVGDLCDGDLEPSSCQQAAPANRHFSTRQRPGRGRMTSTRSASSSFFLFHITPLLAVRTTHPARSLHTSTVQTFSAAVLIMLGFSLARLTSLLPVPSSSCLVAVALRLEQSWIGITQEKIEPRPRPQPKSSTLTAATQAFFAVPHAVVRSPRKSAAKSSGSKE